MKAINKGLLGLAICLITSSASAQVWTATQDWDKVTAEAGIAWPANSGKTWQQKYALWIRGMNKIKAEAGYWTFEMKDPAGKTMPSMVVDCADTSLALRVLFASWYQLPFMFRTGDLSIGHWGVRNVKTGASVGYISGELKNRKVGSAGSDIQVASIGGNLGSYLDKLLTNKKVGHLIIFLLGYAGALHFGFEQNTYNIKATAIREGDMGIERWDNGNIGHTAVVKRVDPAPGGKLLVELIEGWLPPRQARWGTPVDAHAHLADHLFGGSDCWQGEGATCTTYAKLGGGVKRWRIPKYINGAWTLKVAAADLGVYIKGTDWATLGKRVDEFEALLQLPPPEELLKALLVIIGTKRISLTDKPSGCGARTAREDTFAQLYELMRSEYNMTPAQVDAKYRKTVDYVFRPLDYSKSGTCCWNGSTRDMGASVRTQALAKAPRVGGACAGAPAVFMKTNGKYDPYQAGAGSTAWVPYRNDENCPQGSGVSDAVAPFSATDYCTAKPWLNDAAPELQ